MRVIVTRPQADAEQTARALRHHGHEALLAPLLRIEPISTDLSGDWSAVVITSANALGAISDEARAKLISLPLFAVGDRTARTATSFGFVTVHSASGDGHDLVQLICERHGYTKPPMLYLAGEDRAFDLVKELKAHHIEAEMRIVYRAATSPFPPELVNALKGGKADAVLHFSKRSAENYLAGATAAGIKAPALALRQLCLSEQIAQPLKIAGATAIAISSRPEEAALIELLSTLSD